MSRPRTAAFLPTPGDPFVAEYWCRNYDRVWRGEVDKLRVLINGQTNEQALEHAVRAYENVGADVIITPNRIGHGQAINALLETCVEHAIVLVEDDAYVRTPGVVFNHLMMVAEGVEDVIGSPRGGMSPTLEQLALQTWGPITGPDGSTGHGLWPCFLFARRENLFATNRIFEARNWSRGERIPGINFVVESDSESTDCMTVAAYELRSRLNISLEVQYKELFQKDFPTDSSPPWFHAGGLSNEDFLRPDWTPGARKDCGGSNEGLDWAHRCWWWERVAGLAEPSAMRTKYLTNLDALIEHAGVQEQLAAWTPTLLPWINWKETA